MSLHSWLQNLRFALTPGRRQRKHGRGGSPRAAKYRPNLEVLEDRSVPAFLAPVDYTVGDGSFDVKAGDFNGDGNPDLTTANFYDDTVSVLLGNADGTFQPAQTIAVGPVPRSMAVGDFNNDGNLDLAAVINAGTGRIDFDILLGNGDGTFAAGMRQSVGDCPALYIATGDLNADGTLDLVASLENDLSWAEHVSVLLGRGDGTFALAATYGPYPYSGFPSSPALADVNSDGHTDVIVTVDTGLLMVFLSTADGTLQEPSLFSISANAYYVAVGDFNGDGKLDLATDGGDVLLGNGDGTFQAAQSFAGAGNAVTVGDFNGDGLLDLLGTNGVVLGQGDGGFGPPITTGTGGSVVVADFNADGRPDAAAAGLNTVSVALNDGAWPDQNPPWLQIRDITVTEGNSGTVAAVFTVTLSAPSAQDVTVQYATANGTATAGSDYQATSGTLTIPAGQTTGTITVQVNGDRLGESNEKFVVNLSSPTNATIVDDQGVATIVDDEPHISISDVTKAEGKKNQTTLFTFTVTLLAAYDQPVTLSHSTVNGTATTSDNDYIAKTGTLTFAPGETVKTITIEVKGDSKKESNETFTLELFGAGSNALFLDWLGLGTILNDD